jgi:branched-chain amino acid transport system permease protein
MTGSIREGAARLAPLVLLVALVIAVACAATFAPIILQRRVTQALIMLVGVVGLYVFAGNSGVFSFGNVGFMAIAAYVSALLTMAPGQKSVFLPDLPKLLAE